MRRCDAALIGALLWLAACGPAEAGLAINVQVSPAWGSQITRVQLADMMMGEIVSINIEIVKADCNSVEAMQTSALDWNVVESCSGIIGGITPGEVCYQDLQEFSEEPAPEGFNWQLSTGSHALTAVGFDPGGNILAHDCLGFVVIREGEFTDVTLRL